MISDNHEGYGMSSKIKFNLHINVLVIQLYSIYLFKLLCINYDKRSTDTFNIRIQCSVL